MVESDRNRKWSCLGGFAGEATDPALVLYCSLGVRANGELPVGLAAEKEMAICRHGCGARTGEVAIGSGETRGDVAEAWHVGRNARA